MAKKNDGMNQLMILGARIAGIVIFSVFLINTYVTVNLPKLVPPEGRDFLG